MADILFIALAFFAITGAIAMLVSKVQCLVHWVF